MRHGGDDGRQRKARSFERQVCRTLGLTPGVGVADCEGVEAKAWSGRTMSGWDIKNQVRKGTTKIVCNCNYGESAIREARRRKIRLCKRESRKITCEVS